MRQVLRYIVSVFFLCIGLLFSQAQLPVANFTSDKVSGCSPLVVSFQDQSTGDPKFWNWDLGNGQLSNLQNPVAVYSQPGTYTISLVVRNANGTNGITKTNYITVNPSPTVAFISDKLIACMPAVIQFTDQSSDGAGTVNKWDWDFGDGTTSNVQNPSHTYNNLGFYTVTLTITSTTGCIAAIGKYRHIRVVSGVTPDFNTSIDSVCKAPFGVNFLNQTSGPGALTYNWDFGNGTNSTATDPTATYNSAGTFTVKLFAQSEYGCSDTITKQVTVVEAVTDFNLPDSACLNQVVAFQNTSTPAPLSSYWDFGDGTNSTLVSPSKTYSVPNTYSVILRNKYSYCNDSIEKQIRILPPPVVDFRANTQIACKPPFTVNFQDISPNAVSWQWDFGDGGTSTQQNPVHTYTAGGRYNVSLTITSSSGCRNTISKGQFIQILRPVLNIDNLPTGGCIPFNFTPSPNVTAIDGVTSYTWDFGDGTLATGISPTHTYIDSGTFNLKLIITTTGGCTDSLVVQNAVRTGPPPTVDFVVDTTTACAFGTIKFKSLAQPADQWTWDFGDGVISTFFEDTAIHFYTDTGTFNVKLTAYNNGCANSITKPQLIKINPPVAAFSDTILNCNQKRTVTFFNTSKVDPSYGAITYQWQFGDPMNTTSNSANPVFTYPALGVYSVTLTVTNGNCTNSITRNVELVSEVADFISTELTPCKNEPVTLSAIAGNYDNITQYEWTVGTNPPFIGAGSVQVVFPSNGTYSVQLTITDVNGCTDSKSVANFITVTGPTSDFSVSDTGGCKNSIIQFNDLASPAGNITQWKWVFGDGKSQTYTSPPFNHQYTDTGDFEVQLTVTDTQGCTDVISKLGIVKITSPKADFNASNTLFCAGGLLQFKDSSSGYITSYNWDFGDGGLSTLKDPSHTYSGRDSIYSVKLVVTDIVGCADSVTKTNYIQIKSPKPDFSVVDTSAICPPLETKFTLRAQDYETYFWDFGDGQTSNLQNPKHFYNTYGTYEAKLYVVGYGGCLDSMTRNITVHNPFTTAMNYTPLDACNELNVDFTISPPANTRFYFYFGDGLVDSSQAVTFSHFYKSPSFYSPYMMITDAQDCQVVVGGPDVVKIYGAEPFFGLDKNAFCDSGLVYFTNYTIANDTIVSSVWDFGDGSTSTVRDPAHTYAMPGTYYASLTATTTRGCTKTLYDTIKVSGTPEPIISSPDVVCIHSNIDFLGSLAVADTSIVWNWSLGNGKTSSQQNTRTSYSTVGSPAITLEAANYLGCKRSITKNIEVVPLPQIDLVADPTIVAGTGIVVPVSYSQNVLSYSWLPSTSLSCTNCPNPYASPQFTTKYKVSVVDSNGCAASRDVTVTVICNEKNYFIPNTFSPNADGMNDVFYPRGSGLNRIQSMRIFNRWGELIFERKDFLANEAGAGWDGTVRGKPADQDVYVYIIEIICTNATVIPFKGNVALIR